MRFIAALGLALILFSAQAQAACQFLQVQAIGDQQVAKGVLAGFPIAIKNNGLTVQNIYISATNNYLSTIDAYFDQSTATLAPGAEEVFNFFVSTDAATEGSYSFPIEISSDTGTGICTDARTLQLRIVPGEAQEPNGEDIKVGILPVRLIQLFPGEKANYDIEVTNNLDEEIIASLDSPSNAFEGSTSFSESDFRVDARSTKIVRAAVTLPPATPGGDYEIVFRVRTSSACCVNEFYLPVQIRAYSKTADLKILREPLACVLVKHGDRKKIELGVRNDGEIEGPFSLQLVGGVDDLQPVTLPLTQFELKQGERDYFNLTIAPPETQPIDFYRFKLQARYLNFLLVEKDFCYKVEGISNLEVEKPIEPKVRRCATESFEFKVTNVGTLSDEYAIETKPLVKAVAYADPETFELTPGESQVVNLIVQTSCITPLGNQIASVVIRPKKAAARTENFEFEIVASGKLDESFLKIDASSQIKAVVGEEKRFIVNVLNAKSEEMPDTVVSIEGLPAGWYAAEGAKTIKPGKTAPFRITFKPKLAGNYKMKIVAKSGLERAEFNSELIVEALRKGIDYSYTIEPVSEGGVVKEAIVTITLRNTGNTKLSGITINSPAQDVNLVPLDYVQALQPGESREMKVQVQPLQDTLKKDILVKVGSSEGIATTKAVQLPALKRVEGAEEFPWKLIIIIVLLILIFAMLSKQTI